MDSPHKRPVIWTFCFYICLPGEATEQSVELPLIWDAIAPMWHQCNGFGKSPNDCPACRTYEIATRFWEVVICPIYMCLTVYEFSFILFDLCLFITIFNFILNYVLIITFWIFTYYKIWIMLIIYCFIWNYWFFLFCNMFGSVLECYELTGVSLLWPWLIKGKYGLCGKNLGFIKEFTLIVF